MAKQDKKTAEPPTQYRVRHAFAHADVYYTRRNQDEVAKLPKAVRTRLLQDGKIEVVPAANASKE